MYTCSKLMHVGTPCAMTCCLNLDMLLSESEHAAVRTCICLNTLLYESACAGTSAVPVLQRPLQVCYSVHYKYATAYITSALQSNESLNDVRQINILNKNKMRFSTYQYTRLRWQLAAPGGIWRRLLLPAQSASRARVGVVDACAYGNARMRCSAVHWRYLPPPAAKAMP